MSFLRFFFSHEFEKLHIWIHSSITVKDLHRRLCGKTIHYRCLISFYVFVKNCVIQCTCLFKINKGEQLKLKETGKMPKSCAIKQMVNAMLHTIELLMHLGVC